MIKNAFTALGSAARGLFRNRGALAVLSLLYLATLAGAYLFFATGVATTGQLIVSAATALAAPLLLLILLAAAAHSAREGITAGALVRRSLADFWKLLLVALPLLALALLAVYLLGKLEGYLPKPEEASAARETLGGPSPRATPPPRPLYWREALVSTLRLLLLGVALPLAAAHLWLSTAREGLKATIKGMHRVLARAFAPQSVLIYAVGLFVFGLMPYLIIFTRTTVGGAWGELLLFGLRLALAFAFTLWGWAITLGALARSTPGPGAAVEEPPPAQPPVTEPQPQT